MTGPQKQNMASVLEPKVAIDFARTLASILIALTALSIGFLRLADILIETKIPVQNGMYSSSVSQTDVRDLQIVLLIFSCLALVSVARIIDWIMDRMDVRFWSEFVNSDNVDNQFERALDRELRNEPRFAKNGKMRFRLDGAAFRVKIYGGGYLIFVLTISLSASACLWYAVEFIQETYGVFAKIPWVEWAFAGALSIYMIYQMMTIDSKIANPLLIGIVIGLLAAAAPSWLFS